MKDRFDIKHLNEYTDLINHNSKIPLDLYEKYSVKRGLRNKDGTGVLVGLTEIGDVHGYIMEEGDKIPVQGRLRYRGYNVQDIVKGFQHCRRHGFEETAFLLLLGDIPKTTDLDDFYAELGKRRQLPDSFAEDMILKAPSSNIMNKLARSILALYSFDENPEDNSIPNVLAQSMNLIAQFPTIVAYAFQAKEHYFNGKSLYIHTPIPTLSTAENLLLMVRPDKKFTPLEAEVLDLALVLHAEHGGGNNSAFSTHVVSSSGTDTYSAMAAAVGSLKGPLHGGAAIRVREMMEDLMKEVKDWKDEEEVTAYLTATLKKQKYDKKGLIYGMGHAVYTISDPRAVLLRARAGDLSLEAGRTDEYNLYCLVEKLSQDIFDKIKGNGKRICANVDFYSGFVYSMLNIPSELYTPIFAVSRITGWCAHRIEEIVSGGRIIRPAYKSVSVKKEYISLTDR
ncbi:MAG: citrate/2-methylcitrate synthase [Spirochaetaceae bacterium]|nr:citrate/2-methylcitrate synthase [Spirochaetaceae bacterium]